MPKPNDDQILLFVNENIEKGDTPEEAISRVCSQYDISGVDIALAYHSLIAGATIEDAEIDEVEDQLHATDPVVEPQTDEHFEILDKPVAEPTDADISTKSISKTDGEPHEHTETKPESKSMPAPGLNIEDIDPTISSEVASTKSKKK